jgi:hypothetical protein
VEASAVRIHHPNRDKPEAKATKAAVILLLLTSAGLTAIVTFGGWSKLQGAHGGAIFYILVYALMAYYVARWNRGVLPVAAALAVIFAVLASVAGPAWFERDKSGFDDPMLEPGILGLLTVILVPVQALLIAFALRGFSQEWNVEVEVADGSKRTEAAPKKSSREGMKDVPMPWQVAGGPGREQLAEPESSSSAAAEEPSGDEPPAGAPEADEPTSPPKKS